MRTDLMDLLSNGIPSKWEAALITVSSVLFGWLSFVLGGIDLPVKWLFGFTVIDFVLGNWAAFRQGQWSPKAGCAGIVRKVAIFFVVALCHGIDVVTDAHFMRNGAIAAYAIMEAGSIVTHIDALGYGHLIPQFVRQGIEAIETKQEKKRKGAKNDEFEGMH